MSRNQTELWEHLASAPHSRLSRVDAAYIAGLIDGEGSVCINRYKASGRRKAPKHELRVAIANSHLPTILWVHHRTGGWISEIKPRAKQHKMAYVLWLSSQGALWLLEQTLPFLKIKHARAMIGIEFQRRKRPGRGSVGLTEAEVQAREDLRNKLLLN